MAGHEWEDWFEREEFIAQISDIRVQNLQVEREVVQKRTFTRWMNLHLEKCKPPIEVHDLFQDIQDGHILMALLEELSGCQLLNSFKKSSHRIFRLNNIAKVLSFLEERNVKLVSIDAADVADGNSSIILGLIWNIILFFQIKELTGNIRSQFPSSSSLSSIPTSSDSDASYCSSPSDERQPACTVMREHSKAIKKLLQWVQKRTRKYGVAVQDFGKSWTSGVAFLAVIKSIDPSLVDMRKALLRSPRENMEDAFRIAHYSLGIPRLLEPEDVMINKPDEQCIITYVSQFLEHFPGLEEWEEPSHCIERSVSMGRLNFRDSDYHIRNSAQRSRVKERSYMFQRDCAQPPPKILISSVSEDRSSKSRLFRPAATRSWSSEDILADSPHMDDISSSVVEDPRESVDEGLNNSTADSQLLSFTCSALESVTGDSAINSPDSLVESEFGIMQEKPYDDTSDSLFCDSETAWDVYRATPVEVTSLDEEFFPSLQEKASHEQSVTESHIDEGIYSLSSLGSVQEPNQGYSEHVEVEKETGVNPENCNQPKAQEQELEQNIINITKESESELVDTMLSEQEPASGLCVAEIMTNLGTEDIKTGEHSNSHLIPKNELTPHEHSEFNIKHSLEKSTEGEAKCLHNLTEDQMHNEGQNNSQSNSLIERKYSEDAEVENEYQPIDPFFKTKREDLSDGLEVLKEAKEEVVETLENANEGVLSDNADHQTSMSTDTTIALADICPTKEEETLSTSPKQSRKTNITMISISGEPQGDIEREAWEKEGYQTKVTGTNATDTDVSMPQKEEDLTCNSADQRDKNLGMVNSSIISEDLKPTACGQRRESLDEHDNRNGLPVDTSVLYTAASMEICEAKQESEFPPDKTFSCDSQISLENTTQEKKPNNNFSEGDETQQSNVQKGTLCHEAPSVSRNIDIFCAHFDGSSLAEDIIVDPIEPMDIFYPDKEEPMLTDPPDTDMKSWPSVLSVSALEPAPTAEAPADDNPLSLLDKEWWNEEDVTQEKVKTNQALDQTSDSDKHFLLFGENLQGVCGSDVPGDGCNLEAAQQQSPGSSSEITDLMSKQDESQSPPVLCHRKGSWFTEHMESPSIVIAVSRNANSSDSDFGSIDNRELYLLWLLWLLLYSFLVLPQMDLKTLPSLLLNFNP